MSPKMKKSNDETAKPLHSILTILPSLTCLTPFEIYNLTVNTEAIPDNVCPIMFDEKILNSDLIQRPCFYLSAAEKSNNFDNLRYTGNRRLNVSICLEVLLKHLESKNPSWSEIIHFASFLNTQLLDCEKSSFCDSNLTGDLLPGFKSFVVQFMIQMSHDFALPSLCISDRSALTINANNQTEFKLEQLKMRRKWENDPHPYLFFNTDGQTFTFFGFHVDKRTGFLIEPSTNQRLFDNLAMQRNLIQGKTLRLSSSN